MNGFYMKCNTRLKWVNLLNFNLFKVNNKGTNAVDIGTSRNSHFTKRKLLNHNYYKIFGPVFIKLI